MTEIKLYKFKEQIISQFSEDMLKHFDLSPHINIIQELLGSVLTHVCEKYIIEPRKVTTTEHFMHGYGLFVKIMSEHDELKHNRDRIRKISVAWREIVISDKTALTDYAKKWQILTDEERAEFATGIRARGFAALSAAIADGSDT